MVGATGRPARPTSEAVGILRDQGCSGRTWRRPRPRAASPVRARTTVAAVCRECLVAEAGDDPPALAPGAAATVLQLRRDRAVSCPRWTWRRRRRGAPRRTRG